MLEHLVEQPSTPTQKPPVLFIHGAWHGAFCYRDWLSTFASLGYPAHAISLPGYGESKAEKRLNAYGGRDYLQVIEQVMTQLGPKAVLLGHSMGGHLVQRYLLQHSVPKAVLVATAPVSGLTGFNLRYVRKHPGRFFKALFTAELKHLVDSPELVRELFITEGAALSPEALCAKLCSSSLKLGLEAGSPLKVKADRPPSKVLVVAAESDGCFTMAEEERTAKAWGAEVMVVKGQSHDLMLEKGREETARRIAAWLDQAA